MRIYNISFYFIILADAVLQVLGCLAPSYNKNKQQARCSSKQGCPSDTKFCHLGVCCLGCGQNLPDPTKSCFTDSDCKSKTSSKSYRCTKPVHNTDKNVLGVCCESNGCLAPSYNKSKKQARCSSKQDCPPDAQSCHRGVCCLGCGQNLPDPTTVCFKDSDCKSINSKKRFRCTKPGHNTKREILGVCCENNGY